MKKITVIAFAVLASLSGCKKGSDSPSNQTKPTSLSITVTDESGNAVSGVSVKLYGSQFDFIAGLGGSAPISSATTSTQGIVTFNNVSVRVNYYWYAVKGCQNNFVSKQYGPKSVTVANTTAYTSCKIQSSGDLVFNNTSSNPYAIYIDGTLQISTLAGGATQTLSWQPTGPYIIRVLQLSGYLVYPTEKTYTGVLSCGGTLKTTFP